MSQDQRDCTESKRSQRLARVFLVLCTLNYAVRLFSVSFSGPMGWYPKELASRMDQAELLRVSAWVEFAVINTVLLIVASLFVVLIILRDCANLVFKGRSSVVVGAKPVLVLSSILAATLFVVFQLIANGQGAFSGTRLAGFGLSGVMFFVGLLTMATFLMAFIFVFDPVKAQTSFDRQASR